MRRSALWLLGCVLALFTLATCSRNVSDLAGVRARGELRWGGDTQGGEPYVFDDPRRPGHLVGFEVDLAEALARELGVRARFVQCDWSTLVPSLERGTFDIALNGLEVTASRAGQLRFSRPYYLFQMRLMARVGDTRVRADAASLRGLRVGTLGNSQSSEFLARNGVQAVLYEGQEEPYIDLQRGRIDAVLLDDIIATRYGVPKADLRVVGDMGPGYYAIGIRPRDAQLADALDTALERITSRGELRQILSRWQIDDPRMERITRWTASDQAQLVQATEHAHFGWDHIKLFAGGAWATLVVSVLAMLLAVPFGMLLAIARQYGPRPIAFLAASYVEVVRGTPVLLQLYVLYFGLSAYVRLSAMAAAVLGLGLNYAAYEAEVYRAGLQAVPKGQTEAAVALGMSRFLTLRRVVMPQAFRMALPGVTNDFIALLKDSSLVSVITVVELTKRMQITAVEVRSWLGPGLACAGMYFVLSFPLSRLSRHLEERMARG
ncbi:MAG: ABC transporter substrate-binding protein/permease [Deltaproteobacteria bacterium]|nr:ABC transporter substrate-binding protein/permease [Deltaproteobacteria bacterium]